MFFIKEDIACLLMYNKGKGEILLLGVSDTHLGVKAK